MDLLPPHPSRYKTDGQDTFDGFEQPPERQPSQAEKDREWRAERDKRNAALHVARTAWTKATIDVGELTRKEMLQALVNGIDVEGYGKLGATSTSHVSSYVEDALAAWRKRTGAKAYRPKHRATPGTAPEHGKVKGTLGNVPCPTCGAKLWDACTDPSGREKGAGIFHKERHKPTAPRELVCPTCAAASGKPCRSDGLKRRRPTVHATRQALFRAWHEEYNQLAIGQAHINADNLYGLQLYDVVAVLDEYVSLDTAELRQSHPNAKIVGFLTDRVHASVEYIAGGVRPSVRLTDLQKLAV